VTQLVIYSLAALGSPACERQWMNSIRTLRRFNRHVPVHLALYGQPRAETFAEADRQGVEVAFHGPYEALFAHRPRGAARLFAANPTLHKILSLRALTERDLGQVLYLDCDTHLFGDVGQLFRRYHHLHFVAREEPGSRRSHYGYDPAAIDEDVCARTAMAEGLSFVPPYNTGVMLMNGGLWRHLGALGEEFLNFVWRLTPGAAPMAHRLPYPSANAWIVEEIALWLTLGRLPNLTHGTFAALDVAQNGEAATIAPDGARPILAHYFSGWEDAFFDHLRTLETT
jgi:hypothetical protein